MAGLARPPPMHACTCSYAACCPNFIPRPPFATLHRHQQRCIDISNAASTSATPKPAHRTLDEKRTGALEYPDPDRRERAKEDTMALYCDGYYSHNNSCYSRWYDWGRWIVVGAIIVIIILAMFSCACLARRRRRRGAQPLYGTGWMAPGSKAGGQGGHAMNNYQSGYNPQGYDQQGGYNQAYNQQQPQQPYGGFANPPPAYGQQQQHPQYTGTTFNPNDGYYGDQSHQQQQQYGVQPPQSAYQRDGQYNPPTGPPPGK
ncbi:Uncharacterized protein TCAP_05339 [Tolypocladium capitatum]|uniref:Protein RCR2 n=1 Tax=Tolypocladium capitatum TaxID=45235 RepID=A0A2K3QB05_9HYPO|nr:Uncharacterized protein TCAP_05339 [Tolypocladium capitatum]